jgi:hypothetical protein
MHGLRRLLKSFRGFVFCGADAAADAERLIARFRDRAYVEARDRVKGRCVDGNGSARYWTKVKLEIARRQGIAIGLTGADMRA